MRRGIWIVAAAWLAACSPPATEAPATSQPSAALAAAYPDCTWGEVRGAGAVIGSFACESTRLVADEALPGFVVETTGPDGVRRWPVVRLFDTTDGAMDSTLPAVRAASPAPGNEACVFVAVAEHPGWFEFRPTGALLDAYNQFISGAAQEPSQPCGQWGPSEAGNRYFFPLPGAPNRIAAVETGSDLQIYDWAGIRAAP